MKEEKKEIIEEVDNIEKIKKTKRKKKVIIILVAFVIGLTILFTLTPYRLLFTPKKVTFLSYMAKDARNMETLIENIEKNNLTQLITNDNSKSIDFNLELNSKKIDGQLITDKDFFALKLNENYLLLENEKLDQLLTKFGMDSSTVPSKIEFKSDSLKLTNGEKKKIYNFITDCTINILEKLESDKIVANPKAQLKIDGETKILRAIEVQLTETDLFMLQKEFLTELKNDKILNIFIDKINKIGVSETIDKKELEKEIEKYITYLDYAKAYYDLQEAGNEYYIIYKIYSDENGVVAREIIEKYNYEGQSYEDIICSLITLEKDYYEFKWFTQEGYSSAYYNIISDKITTTDSMVNHEIKYSIEGFYVGTAEGEEEYQYVPLNGESVYNLVIDTIENGKTKVELIDPNNLYNFALSYEDNSAELEFSTKYNEIDILAKVLLKANNTIKEELLNNGAILINDKSQEELIAEFTKIGNKLSEIFVDKK